LEYSMLWLIAGSIASISLTVWPWIGVFAFDGAVRWLNAATLFLAFAYHWDVARGFRYPLGCLVFWPLLGPLMLVVFWQVSIRTIIRGRITWRGTSYPLAELRKGRLAPRTPPPAPP